MKINTILTSKQYCPHTRFGIDRFDARKECRAIPSGELLTIQLAPEATNLVIAAQKRAPQPP